MLRPAVLLDAAMTVSEARARLAQHGLWLDSSDDAAQRVVRDYVNRLRLAWERRAATATAKGDARASRSTDSPGMPAPAAASTSAAGPPSEQTALAALERPLRDGRVAVRREEAMTVYWYTFTAEEVLRTVQPAPGDERLGVVLNLRESGTSPSEQVDVVTATPAAALAFSGVILDGADFVGISEPRQVSKMTAPSTPLSGPASRSGSESPVASPAPAMAGSEPPDGAAPAAAPTNEPVEVRAYPKVVHPEQVTESVAFDVLIGLGKEVMAGQVDQGPMVLTAPISSVHIDVDVQVIADGFSSLNGWRHVLRVVVNDPHAAAITIQLVPDVLLDAPIKARTITVHYAYDGVTRGSITRNIAVLKPGIMLPQPDPRGIDLLAAQPAAPNLTMSESAAKPDIELNIARADSNDASGRYVATMRNAHGLPVPDKELPIDLGSDPRTFAHQLILDMPRNDGDMGLMLIVDGASAIIADQLPPEFFELLRAVHAKVGASRPVTLQLNSADPYVPWELALVDPPLDVDRVPLLSAQVSMGRWILGSAKVAAPPRTTVPVRSFAVMAGMYMAATSGLKKLPMAEAEVAELEANYKHRGVMKYDCTMPALTSLLTASVGGGAQLVHFAGHGQVDPLRPGEAALFLSNGKAISPVMFRNTALGRKQAPFMFLNACLVGVGGEMLGDYGGFAGLCLAGNFSGFLAPIWAVNDVIAKWIALEFYRQAMASPPRPIAEILRDIRQQYADHPEASSYLAYVYYGNPYLTFT